MESFKFEEADLYAALDPENRVSMFNGLINHWVQL